MTLGDVGRVLGEGLSRLGDGLGIVEPALGADHVIGPAMEGVVVLGPDTHHECDEAQVGGERKSPRRSRTLPCSRPRRSLPFAISRKWRLELTDHALGVKPLLMSPRRLGVSGLALVDQAEFDWIAGQDAVSGREEILILRAEDDILELRDQPDLILFGPVHRDRSRAAIGSARACPVRPRSSIPDS